MQVKYNSNFYIAACLFALISCGSDDDNSRSNVFQEQQQDDQGIYRALLAPLNFSVAGNTTGTLEVSIQGDEILVESNITGAPGGVKHLQNITVSGLCPSAESDSNGDGLIDIVETFPSTGPILIPLDSDVGEQLNGIDFGPISNASGNYIYRRSTSLSRLLADLQAPDPDTLDLFIKLPSGQNINLSKRVVVIHGINSTTRLPDSVRSLGDLSRNESLPIACGELRRITNEGPQASL